MNNQVSTETKQISKIFSLEDYNNLLGELKDSKELDQISVEKIQIEIDLPETVIAAMKIIGTIFKGFSFEEYLKHCILGSVVADVDSCLSGHHYYTELYNLVVSLWKPESAAL